MTDAVALKKEIIASLKSVKKLQKLVQLVTPSADAEADGEGARVSDVVGCLQEVFDHFDGQGVLAAGEAAAAATPSAPAAKRKRTEDDSSATAKVGAWVLARWEEALAILLAAAVDPALAPSVRNTAVDGWMSLVARASLTQAQAHILKLVEAFACATTRGKEAPEGGKSKQDQQNRKWEKVATRKVAERLAAVHLANHTDVYKLWLQTLLRRLETPASLAGNLTLLAMTPLPTEVVSDGESMLFTQKTASAVMSSGGKSLTITSLYGDCWTAVLKHDLPDALLKKVLRVMSEAVLPFVRHPLTLLDMLTTAYARGGIISVLSLKGIYYMMTHNNLFVPDSVGDDDVCLFFDRMFCLHYLTVISLIFTSSCTRLLIKM